MLPPSRDWGDYSEIVAAASIYQHHIMILEYIADENQIAQILVKVPGKEDKEAPTIHLARVGQNHFHAGMPVACRAQAQCASLILTFLSFTCTTNCHLKF
jgi:hypothetical protein